MDNDRLICEAFAVHGWGHAECDEAILGIKPTGSHDGWTSGNLLRSYGLAREFKKSMNFIEFSKWWDGKKAEH